LLLISLTNGQLYSVAIPLDGTAVTGIIEIKDSSYVGQIRSIIATPVKFINAIRNNSKSRISGLARIYLDFVFPAGVFPLETIARCAEYPSNNIIALPELYEYVLTYVSSRVSFNDQSMTLAEA
jgi:hypothetical protein